MKLEDIKLGDFLIWPGQKTIYEVIELHPPCNNEWVGRVKYDVEGRSCRFSLSDVKTFRSLDDIFYEA